MTLTYRKGEIYAREYVYLCYVCMYLLPSKRRDNQFMAIIKDTKGRRGEHLLFVGDACWPMARSYLSSSYEMLFAFSSWISLLLAMSKCLEQEKIGEACFSLTASDTYEWDITACPTECRPSRGHRALGVSHMNVWKISSLPSQ